MLSLSSRECHLLTAAVFPLDLVSAQVAPIVKLFRRHSRGAVISVRLNKTLQNQQCLLLLGSISVSFPLYLETFLWNLVWLSCSMRLSQKCKGGKVITAAF